ncbi:MAG: hypothetical protein QOI17_1862 [Gaiellales bacterium]|jgi:hypothetical protein|nr:hypothetical protein [Gaiellales bacterium]
MGRLTTTSRRSFGWIGLAVVMLAALTVTAVAMTRNTHKMPPKRPLAVAVHNALTARPVAGVSASFVLSEHLLPGSSTAFSSSPLAGATGKVWASGGHVRLLIHSQLGTEQLTYDGTTLRLFDPKQHTVYELTPKQNAESKDAAARTHSVPSVSEISHMLTQLSSQALLSGAIPDNVAGQPAYTVKLSPRHNAGLIGQVQLAWDATHGVPLRFAVYPRGSTTPAIELAVSHISFGKLSASDLALRMPHSTKVEHVHLPTQSELHHASRQTSSATGPSAVARAVGFRLAAPVTLAGQTREVVRSVDFGGHSAALLVYGHGLGSVIVLEQHMSRGSSPLSVLPSARVNGLRGRELETTLGTLVQFSRGGVTYTVVGSQTAATIMGAAQSLG